MCSSSASRRRASPPHVQAVWLKQALAGPSGSFPASMVPLYEGLVATVQNIKAKLPNVRVCHLSSRIYAGYADSPLNPEPYAYEGAFAVRLLAVNQIKGNPELNHDPDNGPVLAPWLAWGPYLWADGLTPRSDGLIWECADLAPDGTHPSPSGRMKVAQMLMGFYTTHPTAAPWFLAQHPADLNGDGVVNGADLGILLAHWGTVRRMPGRPERQWHRGRRRPRHPAHGVAVSEDRPTRSDAVDSRHAPDAQADRVAEESEVR